MKTGDIVKYSRPQEGEVDLRFILLDDPGQHDRVDIQLVCDEFIKPIERVSVSDIEPAQ